MQHADMRTLFRVFLRIGMLSFGGPAAQIALMHRELVEERDWLQEEQFLTALSFCMLLPGPEAMQLATYAGWRLRGLPGGLMAGLLFVIPGAVVVLALSLAYAYLGSAPLVEALFVGVKAAVIVVVLHALMRIAGKALLHRRHWVIAFLSFLGIFALDLPFPLIIALAGAYGYFNAQGGAAPPPARHPLPWRSVATWGVIWWTPVALAWASGAELLTQIGVFFSKLAVVTFGGAYAVLAYMTQEIVAEKGWLTTAQMVDGLGLAETTPGPLILVTEFAGFQAGFAAGGPGLALLAALMTLWVTFAPCFLWIFAGAPFIELLTHWPRLSAALRAVTAAVVGVIANLSIWFALHVAFGVVNTWEFGPLVVPVPELASVDAKALLLTAIAALLLLYMRLGLATVVGLSALAGGLLSWAPAGLF